MNGWEASGRARPPPLRWNPVDVGGTLALTLLTMDSERPGNPESNLRVSRLLNLESFAFELRLAPSTPTLVLHFCYHRFPPILLSIVSSVIRNIKVEKSEIKKIHDSEQMSDRTQY
jgi:hypothetical protein